MANERTYPCLPCRDIDQILSFYESLGFTQTYRQLKPNPYAVVKRDDIQLHFFGMENFEPANSYGSVIVVVPDSDELYKSFAEALRSCYGKLPTAGIPRILRPRTKEGTVRGFSVVDPGGNWLRISKLGDTEEKTKTEKLTGLARAIEVAARLGDARGDDIAALEKLENGLAKFPDAPSIDTARALLYKAELAVRLGNSALAQSSFQAIELLHLSVKDRSAIANELAQTEELVYRN